MGYIIFFSYLDADVLLGRPIQQEIAHEAGADVALEALSDVLTAVNDVSQKAVVLHEQCSETRGLALVAKERLADLRHQVDMAKRQCVGRDRALCDTLDVSGLDVVIKLEMVGLSLQPECVSTNINIEIFQYLYYLSYTFLTCFSS